MLERMKAHALSVVRWGNREVLYPPEKIGVGNLFYVWMQADRRRARGEDVVVRTSEASEPWREWFPELFNELIVDDSQIRFTDRRLVNHYYQEFGVNYTPEDLSRFIDTFVLPSGGRLRKLVDEHASPKRFVLNVRRGDYYSVEKFRHLYAFDIAEYVRAAVVEASEAAPIDEIFIVSDNVEWCRAELQFLTDYADVAYVDPELGPAEHLAILAGSPRLILANSTFSYWGGYLSNRYYADNAEVRPSDVVVPIFHSRLMEDSSSYHLDPRWTVIRDLAGGWEPPAA